MTLLVISFVISSELPTQLSVFPDENLYLHTNASKEIQKAPLPFFLKPLTGMIASKINSSYIDRELKTHMDFLETYLSEAPNNGEYFCGTTLSGADIQMLFPLEGAFRRVPLTESNYPKLHAYVRRVQGREAYKRAAARATEAAGVEYVPFSDLKE